MLRILAMLSVLLLLQTQAMALAAQRATEPASTPVRPVLFAAQKSEERRPGPADLKEAIEIALKRYGGKAADAETVVRNGRTVHEVRILLDDGSVRTVRIDPKTGAIIPQRR
jgi:hypothetical protein